MKEMDSHFETQSAVKRDELLKAFPMISRVNELSYDELLELYDVLDDAYNEAITKYLEKIESESDKEVLKKLISVAENIISRKDITLIDELALAASLDIFSFLIHSRLITKIESNRHRSRNNQR